MYIQPLPLNVPGRFVTLEHCEGCGQCRRFAPDNVTFDPSDVFCYVYRQPGTATELVSLQRAIGLCPVGAMTDMQDARQKGMD